MKLQSSRRALRQVVFAGVGAVVLIVQRPVALAQQADRARTEALARRATERLQALQREADRLTADERTLLGDLRKLEVERQLKAEELKQLDADAAAVQTQLGATADRLEALERLEVAERPQLRARIAEIYKLGQARYLRLLLATSDFRRLGQASRMVAALATLDRARVASYQRTRDELTAARATLRERERTLAALHADAEKAQAATTRAAQARAELVRDIDRKRDLNAQLSGELQAAQQRLQGTLRSLASGAPVETTALPLRPFRGELDWPVVGTVRRRFGRAGGVPSNGIEIGADEGAEARAIHDGTVAFAGAFAGFGNLVIVDHGSQAFSLYGELLNITAQKGARVEGGQPVGTVGPTPSGTAGLYFELRIDGRPVDPLQWLKKK